MSEIRGPARREDAARELREDPVGYFTRVNEAAAERLRRNPEAMQSASEADGRPHDAVEIELGGLQPCNATDCDEWLSHYRCDRPGCCGNPKLNGIPRLRYLARMTKAYLRMEWRIRTRRFRAPHTPTTSQEN